MVAAIWESIFVCPGFPCMVCDDNAMIDGMKTCCATDAQLRCSTRCSRVEVESRVRGPGRLEFKTNGCSSRFSSETWPLFTTAAGAVWGVLYPCQLCIVRCASGVCIVEFKIGPISGEWRNHRNRSRSMVFRKNEGITQELQYSQGP